MRNRLLTWWTWPSVQLQRISKLLGAAWIDGIYLTAWPRVALLVPLILFLFGLFEGATHWSLYSTAEGSVSGSIHAVDFSQMLPLLFIAAICGAFSSQFGLLLVAGFAIGDFFLAAPAFDRGGQDFTWAIFRLYAPQLLSYLAFFLLAVTPALTSKVMAASLPIRFRRYRTPYLVTAGVTACAVEGISVYAWTLAAPMIVRSRWLWAGATPPVAVIDYVAILDPWLPLTAAAAMAGRTWLAAKAAKSGVTASSAADVRRKMGPAKGDRSAGAVSKAVRAIGSAVLATLLISGFFDSIYVAGAIFAIIFGLFLVREFVLPKIPGWGPWSRTAAKIPLGFRWAGSVAAAFLITRTILFAPGLAARDNGVPGAFGAEIFCFLLSLAAAFVLLPRPVEHDAPLVPSRTAQTGVKVFALLVLLALATRSAYAGICLDPVCCFGGDSLLAALVVAALIGLALTLGLEILAGALAEELAAAAAEGFAEGAAELEGTAAEAAEAEEAADAEEAEWEFGDNKSEQKWQNQMEQRGWTPEQIDDAIANGDSFPVPNNVNPGNSATRYVNPETGRSVVIDNVTNEVIHVGGDGFEY